MNRRMHKRYHEMCMYGQCGRPARRGLHFDLDLKDGGKPLRIFSCSEDHYRHLRRILEGSAPGERHA